MITAYQQALPLAELTEVPTASDWCRRWTHRTPSWRHRSDGGFDASCFEVHPLPEKPAKAFVLAHHYSASYPSATRRFGLYRVDSGEARLSGVAVFGIPAGANVLTRSLPELDPNVESLVCSRFVLTDACPGNSESWFLSRCFSELRAVGVKGVVSFADPVPRRSADGRLTAIGHIGRIYQATNAVYTGRATARTLVLLPDGTILHDRAAQKIRRQEQGHRYCEEKLIQFGAAVPRAGADPAEWLRQALADIGARRIRHRGAHRYIFRLGANRREREAIRLGDPPLTAYPKLPDPPG
ncbi:Mom family adenine methylcarbamoylation protein [Actinacidiphila yeochonensis]|uniref:Mom family adenine methylcarbamoylation protein n=1 Tax=Actinacidiphila yeochonensis TaxID=89050 RepID=UPI0018E3D5BB|nr:hypothetical protein [Actinacidiphila yeochonensis]